MVGEGPSCGLGDAGACAAAAATGGRAAPAVVMTTSQARDLIERRIASQGERVEPASACRGPPRQGPPPRAPAAPRHPAPKAALLHLQAQAPSPGSTSTGSGGAQGAQQFFEPASAFAGARQSMAFKLGHLGLGYYLDISQTLLPEVRPLLPEHWRDVPLREERLKVDAAAGCGLSLEHSEFGFAVDGVEAQPGQPLQPGEVIVAIEGRSLAGLSGPQMQASFAKRRVAGARLHVASVAEVKEFAARDPSVLECWDPGHQRVYYFHKKTGRSGWTREELKESEQMAEASSGATQAPLDLASFLSHGFAKQKEPIKKKRKREDTTKASTELVKDESDLAREEKQRWNDWNAGGQGGYTEQFFERYKGCQSNPSKPKKDKRMMGSVGPGQGMEYMARWTGSNNSFN